MSVVELRRAWTDGHLATCPNCRSFQQDMLALTAGLEELSIARPMGMHAPLRVGTGRPRFLTLVAAMLAMLLVFAVGAVVYTNYFEQEDADGPGTRDALFYTFGREGSKKAKTAHDQPRVPTAIGK